MVLAKLAGSLIARRNDRDGNGQPDQPLPINQHDGIDTTSEKLIPGYESIERIRWFLEQSNTALVIPTLIVIGRAAYLFSPLQHLHVLVWVGLVVYVIWIALERLNALLYAKTWAVFSGFLILTIAILGCLSLFGIL